MEKKPVRYALALAIFVYDDKTVVACKRLLTGEKDYPGYWSIPSQRITQKEYQLILNGNPADKVVKRLCNQKLSHLSVENIRLLKSGERRREKYDLKMLLLAGDAKGALPTKTEFYEAIQPMNVISILTSNNLKCGTCISLLHQYMVDIQKIDPGFYFLEIPPSMASANLSIEKYTPEQLWKLATGNYHLLLSGKLGGDGKEIRSATLDKALNKRFDKLITADAKFLDVGCGDGKIVEQIRTLTPYSFGLDLQIVQNDRYLGYKEGRENIFEGSIYSLRNHFVDISFDIILLNLVVQWLPDLNLALDNLKDIIAPKGKLIITLTTPNATYCGRWRYDNDNTYIWEQIERIPDRKLVMINRMVGPLWFYGRSIITLINKFYQKGFVFSYGEEVFLESYLTKGELDNFLARWPSFRRSMILPPFVILEFENN